MYRGDARNSAGHGGEGRVVAADDACLRILESEYSARGRSHQTERFFTGVRSEENRGAVGSNSDLCGKNPAAEDVREVKNRKEQSLKRAVLVSFGY